MHTRRSPTQVWHKPGVALIQWFSWWWAHDWPKHVENRNKHTWKIVRQGGYLQGTYQDAQSTKYKILLKAVKQAVSRPVCHIPLLCVQWKTPNDGQRNCPKHVEFYSKNKFEKLVHLVGFIIRLYQDLRSPERQIREHFTLCRGN